jgi:hypothetical protein
MTTPADPLLTLDEFCRLIPNRRGTKHVHPKTIIRRVKRGELPKPDLEFADGSKLWKQSTLRSAKIL